MKVLIVVGTRPEAIKMAPVVRACRARPELEVKVCVTAQHRQMLDQTMEIFRLRADFDLDVMAADQTLGDIESLDYLSFLYLMRQSHFIMTDSGGVQEEAPALGKPVIVMRDTTERPEAVEAGTAILAGTETESIASTAERLLNDHLFHDKMAQAVNPYGDGRAAERIAEIVATGTLSNPFGYFKKENE